MVDKNASKFTVQIDAELEDLIPGFLKSRATDIEKVREYLAETDFASIELLGHSLKGNGAGYGFDELTTIGQRIEQAAKEKSLAEINKTLDDLADYLENLEVEFE
ncbi:MAG: Hpt domain-containing protein [Deltaproteobacteria bacterium]|jgi:histidine phosphotransfer protein HptB|nr:Hpt domain-containing protein [Deltaproteobacteria bacterium]MBT4641216.1 Hpt domain-containing protein [Deltaproteobacteria bacterium]MBT6498637.1 Hpt domain-containing protein [Deltaproteobacteria bacterium]MBT6613453.1 Hpt domain-containing protein [Deltaproteobacteria bacterium]MBT7153523.1 Hpt domain-containing protein [Deltaproteobacteria bacterium]